MSRMTPGQQAHAFVLPSLLGGTRSLEDYLAAGPLLVAFHRGIW